MVETIAAENRLIQLLRRLRKVGPGQPPIDQLGISPAQLSLLESVAAAPGCSIQDLADGLALTPPTVSVGVRKLEKAGLLERQPDPDDARAWQLDLTTAGIALMERVQRHRCEKVRRLLVGLTPDEQQTLLVLLERAVQTAENSS